MGLSVVDAGAVIGALTVGDVFQEASRRRLARARASGEQMTLPLSAYSEALVGPIRSGMGAVEVVEAFLGEFGIEISLPDLEVARAAARLRAQHGPRMRLPDALVVATALVRHADLIITTDARWPADVGVIVDVLRP